MKRRYIPVCLCAFAAALLLCAYALYAVCFFRARTPLERAAANLRPEHKMALIDTGERQYLIRQAYLGCYERELKWINSLALIDRLPPAVCSDADAEQTALEFMKAYGLDGGGRVVDTESPFMNFTVNGGKYRTVIVRIDPPAPSDGIGNRPARRGMYVFWIDDDGVLCVCYE